MPIKKREKTNNRYSPSLKRKIAKEYLSGRASYAILAEENGLRDKSVVKEFVKWYRRKLASEPEFETNMEKAMENLDKSKTIEDIALSARIKVLEKQLEHAELKTEMLETMIDIAEERFEIEIRKKFGAKQSNK